MTQEEKDLNKKIALAVVFLLLVGLAARILYVIGMHYAGN